MQFNFFKNTFLIVLLPLLSCGIPKSSKKQTVVAKVLSIENDSIITGAQQTEVLLPLLENKNIALVGNPTSILFNKKEKKIHLVDSLLSLQINLIKVFAPEHGFRGNADAGEVVKDGKDIKTGLPIISLYGNNKKPTKEQLHGIDLLIFDIQDVGARFYTYISTLHYIMEACAENNIQVLVLDRPNPNGHYVDGPILKKEFKSFVGMHPIPVVHGMTIGEYAQMINGEKWLKNETQCDLKIIPLKNYDHTKPYSLPVKPSPNLPNDLSINLYPSLCFFEGTPVSVGRGTDQQFQIYGAPYFPKSDFQFTPTPKPGAKHPKFEGKLCYGENLESRGKLNYLNLEWLIKAYNLSIDKSTFFNPFFKKLAGTEQLQKQIKAGKSAEEIRASWQNGLEEFKLIRNKYLLYP